MSREILFRGKRVDNGEWVEGDLLQFQRGQVIHYDESGLRQSAEVDPATVGQFSGFHDKNEKRAFTGDVVKHDDSNWGYGGKYDEEHDGYLYDEIPDLFTMIMEGDSDLWVGWIKYGEIIGNIHDAQEAQHDKAD